MFIAAQCLLFIFGDATMIYVSNVCVECFCEIKNQACRYCHRVFTFYFEKSVYIIYDILTPLCRINKYHMTNQFSRRDDSSLRETIFKRFYHHGNHSLMQNVYLTQTVSNPPLTPTPKRELLLVEINNIQTVLSFNSYSLVMHTWIDISISVIVT